MGCNPYILNSDVLYSTCKRMLLFACMYNEGEGNQVRGVLGASVTYLPQTGLNMCIQMFSSAVNGLSTNRAEHWLDPRGTFICFRVLGKGWTCVQGCKHYAGFATTINIATQAYSAQYICLWETSSFNFTVQTSLSPKAIVLLCPDRNNPIMYRVGHQEGRSLYLYDCDTDGCLFEVSHLCSICHGCQAGILKPAQCPSTRTTKYWTYFGSFLIWWTSVMADLQHVQKIHSQAMAVISTTAWTCMLALYLIRGLRVYWIIRTGENNRTSIPIDT